MSGDDPQPPTSSVRSRVADVVKSTSGGRVVLIGLRWWHGKAYLRARSKDLHHLLRTSREFTNFTYELLPENRRYLAEAVATICDVPSSVVLGYFEELEADPDLRAHVRKVTEASRYRHVSDAEARYGSRLSWYALVRIRKPRLVVETGTDKGLGGLVIAAALLRNKAEGHPGRYVGFDLNPTAGWLFGGAYREVGEIVISDSAAGIRSLTEPIDLLISESAAGRVIEQGERVAAEPLLSPHAVVNCGLGHNNDSLADWAAERGWKVVAHREELKAHWHPGVTKVFAWDPNARP